MFKKRSKTVETPFGTLKYNYNIDKLYINGIKHTEEILTLFSTSYNLKVLYNAIKKEYDETNGIIVFKENGDII